MAASFTVNTVTDAIDVSPGDGVCATAANECSLRAAIMETNALANEVVNGTAVADKININDGTYLFGISGTGEDLSATGDLDITDSLVLTGNVLDQAAVVINAGRRDRVFHILSNNKVINVEFNYLVITGGRSVDTRGGGGGICIKCEASDGEAYLPTGLGSQNPDINTNFNPGTGFFSGDTTRPNVVLRFVEVKDNYDLVSGSGIMNAGVLTIEDSIFRNNISSYFFRMATGQNGQFNNISQFTGGGNGGAISNWGGKLTIRRSIIDSNRSQTGGAIYSQTILAQFRDEQVLIENSQITNNQAFMGGAIFNVSGDWNFPSRKLIDYGFIISQSTIDNNQAEYSGGAIYNLGIGAMQLSNVTISNNLAADLGRPVLANKGGGIYHSGKVLDLVNTTISGNSAQDARRMGMAIADDAAGGDEIFIDVTQANVDPATNLPWRFSMLNSIVGDAISTDACNGTAGYENFITDIGGNVDDSGTCFSASTTAINGGAPRMKPISRAAVDDVVLAELANNGGIPGRELPDGTFPPTRALISGHAIDAGIDCSANDQRGFGREADTCDAGAFQTASNTKGLSTSAIELPVARNDLVVAAPGVDVFIPLSLLLANDNDPLQRGVVVFNNDSVQLLDQNGASVSVTRGSQVNNTGLIDFINFSAAPDFTGETGFSYTVSVTDPETGLTINSAKASVTVDVNDQNIAPVTFSQMFSVKPGEAVVSDLNGALSINDSDLISFDPEGSVLQYFIETEPAQGSISLNPDGSFIYTAHAVAKGTDGFTYVVKDEGGLTSKPASVSIYIETTNLMSMSDPSVSVEAGKIASIDLSNRSDRNHYFGLKRNSSVTQGEILWLNETTGELLYRANLNATGNDSFQYSVVDLEANSSAGQTSLYNGTATINILTSAINTQPVANSQELTGNSNLIKQIYLSATDLENDALLFQIETETTKGTLSSFDPASGSVIYTANPHESGTDSFNFTASDGLLKSVSATVKIDLSPPFNDVPVAKDDIAMTPNDLPINVNVLINDTDANSDDLLVSTDSIKSLQGGIVEVKGKGIIRYTPPSGFVGEDLIIYQIDDGYSGITSAKLKVTVIAASEGSYQTTGPDSSSQSPVLDDDSSSAADKRQSDTNANTTGDSDSKGSGGGGSVSLLFLFYLLMLILSGRIFAQYILQLRFYRTG